MKFERNIVEKEEKAIYQNNIIRTSMLFPTLFKSENSRDELDISVRLAKSFFFSKGVTPICQGNRGLESVYEIRMNIL